METWWISLKHQHHCSSLTHKKKKAFYKREPHIFHFVQKFLFCLYLTVILQDFSILLGMQHLFPSTWKPCNITYYPSGISKDSCHPHSHAGLHSLSLLCASTSHLRQPFNNTVSQVKPQANVPVSSWAAADYVECLSFAIWTLVRCCKAPLFTTG